MKLYKQLYIIFILSRNMMVICDHVIDIFVYLSLDMTTFSGLDLSIYLSIYLSVSIYIHIFLYISLTSWKVCAYDFYSRVVKYHKTNERDCEPVSFMIPHNEWIKIVQINLFIIRVLRLWNQHWHVCSLHNF